MHRPPPPLEASKMQESWSACGRLLCVSIRSTCSEQTHTDTQEQTVAHQERGSCHLQPERYSKRRANEAARERARCLMVSGGWRADRVSLFRCIRNTHTDKEAELFVLLRYTSIEKANPQLQHLYVRIEGRIRAEQLSGIKAAPAVHAVCKMHVRTFLASRVHGLRNALLSMAGDRESVHSPDVRTWWWRQSQSHS